MRSKMAKHGAHTSNVKGKGQARLKIADDAGREGHIKNAHF